MRWTPGHRSENVEDARSQTGGRLVRRGIPIGLGGLLLLVALSFLTGQDFLSLVGGPGGPDQVMVPGGEAPGGPPAATTAEEERAVDMVHATLDDLQESWASELGGRYEPARLVLFRDAIESACGFAESATGPFYCPGDRKVYLDVGFFDELRSRFGAPGDFAQAYVIAHEVGHHVQHVLGIEGRVRQRQQADPSQANALSVQMELQADCLAGAWARTASRYVSLEAGDIEAGLQAAAAIGDDRIQRMAGRRVSPDSFTHGSSAQRVEAFRSGFSGRAVACGLSSAR